MAVVLGAAMQKGGAGKSTTCVNLAAALADHGPTLLVDLAQQKTLATYYHIKAVPKPNLYHAIMSRAHLIDLVQPSPDGFDMILSDEDMAALEQELPLQKTSIWQLTLRDKLAPLAASYDWIVLDFPPNLGVMAICGLVAAHKVIIPVPSKYLDWPLHLLLDTVIKVRHPVFNPDLEVAGVLVTLHDKRTRSGREIGRSPQRRDLCRTSQVPV